MTVGLAQQFTEFCQKYTLLAPLDKIVVGVSGGPDSLCLLHLLYTLRSTLDLSLVVAHFNHQLRGADSTADEAFVRNLAAHWQLPIFVDTANVAALARERKQSVEETARQLRYSFLWRVANKVQAQKIAVGHNADDQVETLLMHFLRGSGLAGLRGMTPIMAISLLHLHPNDLPSTSSLLMTPHLIRPLLGTPRRQIEAYCRENQLLPRLDSSNLDTTLFRNRLRHELIPYLESYNPNIRQVLHHTAQVVAAEVDQLNDLATQAWSEVVLTQSNHMIQFHRERWLKLSLALRRSTLRRAVYTLHRHLRDISFEQIEQACKIIAKGEVGSQATLPQGLSLVLGYDTFIIAPKDGLIVAASYATPRLATGQTISVTIPGVTSLPSTDWQLRASLIPISQLNLAALKQTGQWEAFLDADTVGTQLNLRPRQPGDTFSPLGLAGHRQKVNEFMINAKIPAQQRNHIPLLVAAGQIIWVCGYRLDERACLNPSSQWVLHLKFEQ